MDEYAVEKKTEQNLIVRSSSKSGAEVSNNKRRRSRYRTTDTKHRATCLRQQSYLLF